MANGILRAYLDTAGGTILVGNPNFYLDGFPVAVEGNPVQSHGDSPHNNAVMVAGSPNFVVNGIPVCTTTSQASCGHFATSSSSFGVGSGARGPSTKTRRGSRVYANPISSLGSTAAATRAIPVWAAYFGATDNGTLTDTQPPVPFYATESYGDVNKYEYVKPMISIMGTRGNLGYSYDTVDQMFASTRYQAIPEKINALPQGKRAIRLYRYDQGPIYEDIRDRYPSGTDAWSGSQILWAENSGISLSNELTRVISDLKLKGCQPDYVIGDMPPGEYLPFGFFDGANWSKTLPGITNDPRSNAPWYNSPSFNNLYTVNGKYGLSFDDIKNRVFHPQLNRQYLYWNRAVFGIETEFLNQFVYNTLKQQWGVTKFSNFNSVVAGETADLYEQNGHPMIYPSYVGDAISPALYAGWNFPNVYGISRTDTTRIIRTNAGSTVSGITADAWSQFLLLLTNIRIAKNESPTVPIRPWVVSPEWTQGGAAFNPKWITDTSIGETIGRKLYWENIRHIILTGCEMLHIWDGGNDTTGKTNNFLSTMNTIIRDINDRTGGFRIHSLNKTRIDFLTSYVVSGSPTANKKYVWRVTPKPGVVLYDSAGNALAVDSDGGAWVGTNTSDIPQYSITPPIDSITQNYKNQYYAVCIPAVADPTDPQGITWSNWTLDFISYFQGNPRSGQGIRAFPWENNPANPSVSSPWHNAIYESVITWYRWGARSFHFHFPYGSYGAESANNANGNAGSFFLSYQIQKDAYTASTPGVTHTNPARWKGFSETINSLIEGKMIPVDANMTPQTNKTQILEPCNVFLYVPTNVAYYDYRRKACKYWRSLSGTPAQKDATYYLKLDGMIDTFKSMKSKIPNGGKLTIGMDVGSNIATPDSITLYRSIVDTSSSAGTDRDASYLSDALELSDWYVLTKLKEADIDVYLEARYPKRHNRIIYEISGIAGSAGPIVSSGLLYNNFTSTEHYLWTSNQLTKTALPATVAWLGARDEMVSNTESPKIHRLDWQSFYMTSSGITNDPYRAWHSTVNGATAHDMWGMPDDYTYYSPHAATFYLYGLSDHHRHYKNLLQPNRPTEVGVRLNNYNTIVFDPNWFAYTEKSVHDTSDPSIHTYRTDLLTANPQIRVEGGNRGPFPPWNGLTFNVDQWAAGPTAYLENSINGMKYWTMEGRNFWVNNVMQPSFDAFIQMLDAFSATAAPVSAVAEGWAGATYPNDYYSKNIIGLVHGLPS